MSTLPVQSAQVQVPHRDAQGELLIDAYLAYPQTTARSPAVVVIQEIFGVNAHIRSVAERLAAAGYVAIAPAIYQRTAPGFEVGYSPDDIVAGRRYKNQTTAVELLGDIQATIAYLRTVHQAKADRIGCIGFCFGGHVAYLAATLPDVVATASFYGAGITTMTPGGGPPTVSRTGEIRGTLYGFYGLEDQSILAEQVQEIETALQQHQIPHQIFRYAQAGHGFFCEQRADYRPAAAADAWTHVLELFTQCLP